MLREHLFFDVSTSTLITAFEEELDDGTAVSSVGFYEYNSNWYLIGYGVYQNENVRLSYILKENSGNLYLNDAAGVTMTKCRWIQ